MSIVLLTGKLIFWLAYAKNYILSKMTDDKFTEMNDMMLPEKRPSVIIMSI